MFFQKYAKKGYPLKDRPIVCASSSLLEPLAKYLDSFLQPFVVNGPTYIKDPTDFNKIEGFVPSMGTILVSIDVVSLYTNISHEEAREVIELILEKRRDKFPPTYFLMELVDIVLEFFFQDLKMSSSSR